MFFTDNIFPDRSTLLQFYYGLNPLLTLVGSGLVMGYSGVVLPLLTKNDTSNLSILNENDTAATWFASIISIAIPFGCIISVFTMKTGRRMALVSSGIVLFLGWIIIATSYEIIQLLIGRFITGLAIGLAATPAPVYLSEIAILKDKTTLTACTNIASCGGIMLIYLIGFVISDDWRWVAATSISIPLLSVTSILFFTPESPRWLLHKGRLLEAKKTLLRIRGLNSETVEFNNEFQQMVNYHEKPVKNIQYIYNVENDQIINNAVVSSELDESKKFRNILNALRHPEVWKPFCILNTYFLFQQFCGIYVVIAYAVDIVVHSGIIADAYFITVIIGVIQFVGGVACVICSRKMGRRSLSIISGVGMSIALGILGFYIQFGKGIDLNKNYSIIPIIATLLFVGTGSFGFLALPWAMIGELYPTKYVNFMGPITCCISGIFNFISLQLYPILVKYDFGITIYFYFTICIIATVFIIIALPETHGHTKSEIEQLFKET
ncbi:hypothetical protein PV327_009097 [Microctonus hyperodae]|uniref:Major facilitator superfamily (MFS) profile domain-containing protein n=1 Tax=Microctonus hyperodae TaxID=165561 RepID=A0AA39KVD2_MICHY|nr:hypothetical protein PV327_009097 [Microctonus hyperodae]